MLPVICVGKKVKEDLRVFENRVMRRISDPKRKEVTESSKKLHNEELLLE
jgi:hypothetical protein